MKKYICEGLAEYLSMDRKPWHMPGHKRKNFIKELDEKAGLDVAAFLSCDVTEVSGTDDLHHPEEMILKSQQQLARIYDSYASFYMVNGSTGGILSAIGAVAEYGKEAGKNKIIIARNCHKSVYNGVKLFGLEPIYVEPQYVELEDSYKSYIYGEITPQQIESLVKQHQDICAVVITSPTYEGVVSDVEGIKRVLKPYGIPLIVDEAHGAHLPFMDGEDQLPKSAVKQGADIVVQSLHKTLPSLTQTAVLHVNNEKLCDGVKKYLSVFMSSSPSYPMLCSMEQAVVDAWNRKKDLQSFNEYLSNLDAFRNSLKDLKNIKLLGKADNYYAYDKTRIVLYGDINGETLATKLRDMGNIEIEMSGINYVVLISTYADRLEDFKYLENTIKLVDEELDLRENQFSNESNNEVLLNNQEVIKELKKLVGTVSVDNIYVYPPGSYIVAAGEYISQEAVHKIEELMASGKRIIGL
ncbi:MAG: aminotransferase class I/II-fold pyridoxal phosphate-dependent enzyme [Lachnospiraceae bacterium]|nr:aminotransferase class I/II-fold pyridoxal phosphate-dependent enzyme [Lachnospiraceae bacterium]